MTEREFVMIGVPSSAGAHGAGQELAPSALVAAGLLEGLRSAGVRVADGEMLPVEAFRADPDGFPTRNLRSVISVARAVADTVERHARTGRLLLVIGGDCTITLGVVAGLRRTASDLRLAYLDGDADLTTPERTRSGVLDATGMAQLLGIADTELARVGDRFPLLEPDQVVLVGYDPDDPDSFDPQVTAREPQLHHLPYRVVADDPDRAISTALGVLSGHPAVVHFDVDSIDSADLPLADFPHFGTGLSLKVARRVLTGLLTTDDLRGIVLTEVNPTKDSRGDQLVRYIDAIVRAVSSSPAG